MACEACHGSTHAVWPNDDPAANDNIAAVQLQGHAGTIIECGTCHGQGSLSLTTNGPHGLHNVDDARWVDENHGDFYKRDKDGCKACHGGQLRGTPLAKTAAARSFRVEDNTVTLAKGDLVSCDRCHGAQASDENLIYKSDLKPVYFKSPCIVLWAYGLSHFYGTLFAELSADP